MANTVNRELESLYDHALKIQKQYPELDISVITRIPGEYKPRQFKCNKYKVTRPIIKKSPVSAQSSILSFVNVKRRSSDDENCSKKAKFDDSLQKETDGFGSAEHEDKENEDIWDFRNPFEDSQEDNNGKDLFDITNPIEDYEKENYNNEKTPLDITNPVVDSQEYKENEKDSWDFRNPFDTQSQEQSQEIDL